MKLSSISKSIFKSSKLFSGALILIYTLVVALLVMLCFFSESVEATFDEFLENYGLADAYITANPLLSEITEDIEKIDGVKRAEASLVIESKTKLPSEDIYLLRYIGLSDISSLRLYNIETKEDINIKEDTVAVSATFAKENTLEKGDILSLENGVTLEITDIVSSPETIAPSISLESWYDLSTFGYIYVSQDTLSKIAGISGFSNQFRIYFEEGTDESAALDKIVDEVFGQVISAQLFEGSAVDRQIKAGIAGTKSVVVYLPGFIIIIGILFSSLFMSRIIKNSYKKIALLRALGFSSAQVSGTFICYSLALGFISIIIGGALGFVFLKSMLAIYQSVYYIPSLVVTGKFLSLIFVVIAILFVGVASCLLCSSGIAKVDPARAASAIGDDKAKVPGFLQKLKIDSFTKISLYSVYRNRGRLIISIFCCIACMILNFLGAGIIFTKNYGLNNLFNERLSYDVTAYCEDDEAMKKIENLSCVQSFEEKICFAFNYDGEVMRFETCESDYTLTKAIDTNYEKLEPKDGEVAIEEGFARRHNIKLGDEICVEGVTLKVCALAREYLYPVMYINNTTAAEFGYSSKTCISILLKDGTTARDFANEAFLVDGFSYYFDNAQRESCARETLDTIDLPCMLFIAIAILIGIVIITNMNILSIKEKRREYATLMVLGTQGRRLTKTAFIESIIQYIVSTILGLPLSYVLAKFLMVKISSSSTEYVLEEAGLISVITALLNLIYIIGGLLITKVYVGKMNILSALGDRE